MYLIERGYKEILNLLFDYVCYLLYDLVVFGVSILDLVSLFVKVFSKLGGWNG